MNFLNNHLFVSLIYSESSLSTTMTSLLALLQEPLYSISSLIHLIICSYLNNVASIKQRLDTKYNNEDILNKQCTNKVQNLHIPPHEICTGILRTSQ